MEGACLNGTIRFTVDGVTDSGGRQRVNCEEEDIPPGPIAYTWTITLPNGSHVNGSGSTASVVATLPGDYTCEFEATVSRDCPPVGPETQAAIEAEWQENTGQAYGYDDFTRTGAPYKSVKVARSDTCRLDITPAASANDVYLTSSNENRVTVAPAQCSSSPQTVTVTGVSKGDSEINARGGSATAQSCAHMTAAAYNQVFKTAAIILVHEENDDEQAIPVGQGQPNATCVTAGANGTLDTTPGGDDQVAGSTITTGSNGICNTSSSGDDVQMIPVNQGQPNQICVRAGSNGFRDTNELNDDTVAGNDITTGPDGVCDTAANATDVMSTDVSTAAVKNYLNHEVYDQSVFTWHVTRMATRTINFDLNRDGQFDDSTWTTAEMDAVINGAGNANYDHNIFLVDNPTYGGFGFADFNQRYVFVNPDISPHPPTTSAHELGHAGFGLTHGSGLGIPVNIMTQGAQTKWRLFKGQWDQINP